MATENIPSRLHCVAEGNVLAGANEILDDDKGKKQSVINQENDQRLETLEASVGTGGSVDSRIESAETEIVGGASSDCNTLGKAEALISTNANDIAALQEAYAALTQNDVVVVAPSDTWPVATPAQNIIYRVVDRTNTPPQYYTDYMWNGTVMVEMAQYNNAIDPRPKKASQNLVTSGGVFDNMGALDVSELNATENPHTLAKYVDLSAAIAAVPTDYQKGGMSIKFIQSSDHKYVQFCCKTLLFSANPFDWQQFNSEAFKLIELVAFTTTQSALNVGDIYYNNSSDIKQIRRKTGDGTFEVIPYYSGAIYSYNNTLYVWNGSDLVAKSVDISENPTTGGYSLLQGDSTYDVGKPDYTQSQTYGNIPASVNDASGDSFWGIKDNIVNMFEQFVECKFKLASSSAIRLALIDEDTLEVLGERWFNGSIGDVIVIGSNELPFDVNHSNRKIGLYLGTNGSNRGIAYYTLSSAGTKTINIASMSEIVTLNSYAPAMTITKKIASKTDVIDGLKSHFDNKNSAIILAGNKLIDSAGAGTDYFSIKDNIVNKYEQLDSVIISHPLASDYVKVALIDEDSNTIIEEKEFATTLGNAVEISASDFDFDTSQSIGNIGVYVASKSSSPSLRTLGYVSSAPAGSSKTFTNGAVSYGTLLFDIQIKKKVSNDTAVIKELINNLQSEINGQITDLQSYINTHRLVNLGEGTHIINTPLTIPDNTKFVGVLGATVIKLGTANLIADLTAKKNITFENITFAGKSTHDSHTSLGSTTAQIVSALENRTGEGSDKGFYISNYEAESIMFTRCEFKNFGHSGIQIKSTHGNSQFYKKFKITDCEFHHSWYGIMIDERCEFSTFMGCTFAYNEIGAYIEGGNNYLSCCHFDKNYINAVISGYHQNNDSHSSISCSSFNHGSSFGIACVDVNNGFAFSGCEIFDGQGILMSNSIGINWNGGEIGCKIVMDNVRSIGYNMIQNAIFGNFNSYSTGTIEGDTTHLSLKNNRGFAQDDYSGINNDV